jgi:hypothetical protein
MKAKKLFIAAMVNFALAVAAHYFGLPYASGMLTTLTSFVFVIWFIAKETNC